MSKDVLKIEKGKILLKFSFRDFPEGIPSDDPAMASPAHWRLEDTQTGRILCWGHRDGSMESVLALMKLAGLGARHASRDELIEAGIMVETKPKIWTPDDGGDESHATHVGETGGFVGGRRFGQEEQVGGN